MIHSLSSLKFCCNSVRISSFVSARISSFVSARRPRPGQTPKRHYNEIEGPEGFGKLIDAPAESTAAQFRRPVLRLYRDVLRTCRMFTWPHPSGESWRKVLERSARSEFEDARQEKDPIEIARLIIVGQHAVITAMEKLEEKHEEFQKEVTATRND
mmetsp:Transcript_37512/g.81293  ORF Transcript_37512/g.81293 Transcript_37512/m.81293 type:complete len:156 (-) Transcript_37512:482-949(-)